MRAVFLSALVALSLAPADQARRPALPDAAQVAGRRLALVVGNDTYMDAPLRNGRNDARAMAGALTDVGFDVTTLEDTTRSSLAQGVLAFGRRVTPNDIAVVFYAGHGVEVENQNYLIPVDFRGRSEDAVRVDALSVAEVTRALGRARVSVLILDACRDNPFRGGRGGARGLAAIEAEGVLVAFATGAGQTADDNAGAANGLFTSELVRTLREPGLPLREVFFRVRRAVSDRTARRQVPALYDQLLDDVVLRPAAAAPAPTTGDTALQVELALWSAIKDSGSTAAFEDYLRQYPDGRFRLAAEDRLSARGAGGSAAPLAAQMSAYLSGMVLVPAGTFKMGSPAFEKDREPVETLHDVRIPRAFRLDSTEVANSQFKRFVDANPAWQKGRIDPSLQDGDYLKDWSGTEIPAGKADHPVAFVSWYAAQAYCQSLGKRLPTEAEWEYAARAGTTSAYWWGETFNALRAVGSGGTRPVGDPMRTNPWSFADMSGNVWEWTSSKSRPYPYRVDDGREDNTGSDARLVRGGSWFNSPSDLRSARRYGDDPRSCNNDVGFRCRQ